MLIPPDRQLGPGLGAMTIAMYGPDALGGKARGEAWFEAQPDLDPERFVFIDETGASTKMARTRGRAPRGERCRAPVPHGH